jgi:transcriptional regulator with XRE-family HTH domain
MTRQLKSVAEIAAALAEDETIQQDVERLEQRSRIVTALVQMRVAKGISQKDIASAMSCDPSKVSRMENGYDDGLTVRDIAKYLGALKATMHVLIEDTDAPAAAQIKQHVFAIHRHLESLADLARSVDGDQSIVSKIHEFYGQVLLNFLMRFDDCYKKIRALVPITVGTPPADPALSSQRGVELASTR